MSAGELAVMRQGKIVEAATAADLAAGTLEHPYSRQLLASSKGYSREAARHVGRLASSAARRQAEPPGERDSIRSPQRPLATRKWPVRRIATKPTPAATQPAGPAPVTMGATRAANTAPGRCLQPRAHERTR